MSFPNSGVARTRSGRFCALLASGLCALGAMAEPSGNVEYATIVPKASTSTLIDIERADSRIVTVGERGHVLYSDDEGASWQQGKMPFVRMLTGVSFVDGNHGWAVGHQSMIFHTSDGGETWTRQLDGTTFQQQANRDNLGRTKEAYEALEAELEASPDPDRELELEDALFAFEDAQLLLEEPAVATNLHDVWFMDRNHGWAVGSFGRLVETRDGGKTWENRAHLVQTFDGFHLNGVTGSSRGEVFLAGEGGTLFRSLDKGQSWEQLDSGYYDTFFGIAYDQTNRVLTAYGIGSALFQSRDLGDTWVALNSPIEATFAGATVTAQGHTALAGPAGVILLIDSTDGSIEVHAQANRMNHSTLLHLDSGNFIVVGVGGARRINLN
jgi:photosystem II stability/assembly factor-like uncharacterized protein